MADSHSHSPRLYADLSQWWPLMSAPHEYAEEAAFYRQAVASACSEPPRTMLELGSGGGNNASHLKDHFQLVLVDCSPAMLAVSRGLNPECEHVAGDMRTVRLDRQFDCVFIHDAICYMTSEADLRQAIESAYVHCRVGGAALFAPDCVRETFCESTGHGGHDGEDRALRYLEWTWDPDPTDSTYQVDYAYVLHEPDGSTHVELDRHTEGLFSRDCWMRLIKEVGFEPRRLPFAHSELPDDELEVFVGVKSAER